MKYDIITPIAITVITIESLKTPKERTQLINGNLWL